MLDPDWLDNCTNELEEIGETLQSLGMNVTLYPVSKDVKLPVLAVALKKIPNDLELAFNLSFSPYENGNLAEIKLLQFGIEFPWLIPPELKLTFLSMFNDINVFNPLGHFSLLDRTIFYRYVCPVPKRLKGNAPALLETISLASVFAATYEEKFYRYINRELSLDEIYDFAVPE
ncbi:MAG: hypothetical protein R3Y53_06275 [Bacillota bacterium]